MRRPAPAPPGGLAQAGDAPELAEFFRGPRDRVNPGRLGRDALMWETPRWVEAADCNFDPQMRGRIRSEFARSYEPVRGWNFDSPGGIEIRFGARFRTEIRTDQGLCISHITREPRLEIGRRAAG